MILLIDNYDSFTYNLYHQISAYKSDVTIITNDNITSNLTRELSPSHIIISPGPGSPKETGNCSQIILDFYKTTPILGVCLGHQLIAQIFNSKVKQAQNIMHGKTSHIQHTNKNLFQGLPSKLKIARYHSLIVEKTPKEFTLDAWTQQNEIMAISHKNYPLYGIQFHPESFLTKHGHKIIKNFLNVKTS